MAGMPKCSVCAASTRIILESSGSIPMNYCDICGSVNRQEFPPFIPELVFRLRTFQTAYENDPRIKDLLRVYGITEIIGEN